MMKTVACVLAAMLFATGPALAGDFKVLALSDIHFDRTKTAVTYAQDTGSQLWANARAKIQAVVAAEHPEFILVLGDLPAHNDVDRVQNDATVLHDLREMNGDLIPLFYLPGNNDSLGGDYHSFTDSHGRTPLSLDPEGSWPALNTVACAGLQHHARGACVIDQPNHLRDGYYSAYPLGPSHKLRLIALNTVLFVDGYVSDDGVAQDLAASDELEWLRGQLEAAESRGEAVWLAMHVPPGLDAFGGDMWSTTLGSVQPLATFVDLLQRYEGTVKVFLTSHTHLEELRTVAGPGGRLAVLGLSIPSISPVHVNNPGFKVLEVQRGTFAPLNFVTQYSTPEATSWGELRYSFHNDYHCGRLRSVFECVARTPTPQLEQAMNSDYTVRFDGGMSRDWPKVDAAIPVHRLVPTER